LGAIIPSGLDESAVNAFIATILPNIVLPEDARPWVDVVFGGPLTLSAADEQVIRNAGAVFFTAAASAAATSGNDLTAVVSAVRAATGKKGADLYMPLRVALTGRSHGPELAPLLKVMPPGKARERLARFT
jgi:glutamyl-tRNA synthetase